MSDEIDLDAIRNGILERLSRPLPPAAEIEFDACTMIDKLSISLQALRMALEAANKAPGLLGLPDENGHLTEACELRSRWYAADLLLTTAVVAVETDGTELIKAVKTMLALE